MTLEKIFKVLNWGGTVFGVLGTALITVYSLNFYGFIAWAISNVFFIIAGIYFKRWYQVALFGIYMIFTCIGVIRVL